MFRGRRGALGLGGRIVGVVLVTAVATLAIAAVTLLGPLEHSLRTADKNTLVNNLRKSTISKSPTCRSTTCRHRRTPARRSPTPSRSSRRGSERP